MSSYAVGDIQGCLDPLKRLLQMCDFDLKKDRLICVGDLVNRGRQSLETLRFLKSLGTSMTGVIGNHDLHLLAIHYGGHPPRPTDTLDDILKAPDREALCHWLASRPILIEDADQGYVFSHAGIPHIWDRKTTIACARELEAAIQNPQGQTDYFQKLYGDHPDLWDPQLTGMDRLKIITNYFTRMRLINLEGRLDLKYKGAPTHTSSGYFPWFERRHQDWADYRFFFGHWGALRGLTDKSWAIALDTGCVWGECLCAYRLEDGQRFYCTCDDYQK